ncbi:MAG: DUF4013 domain-containing protein [Chloroflexi bacterium AL-W]|nr:DUF4013 domain-containing protein [Blastochloris sp.]NOK63645.1 DUF4013 domain-containing protein [Chloroflexi bacterium AL-N1]NOK68539.1 DUF4013 domain-containing protein [Chloroflexi bacterium AL-N10]NOK76025.1 DUF4013 domain-containing protein [Chloroflexi bacterium AL-N5]NOK82496.1 DUF4013 domain-containing protein [Chloroflexi bacterium AL-W]NOK92808.1 DUF4013 domain-containing protein [Chloroflexi bacterium AL-N15]
MNIGKAISYVFDDERWVTKVLLGGLILPIPILNFAAIGYTLKIARNVAYNNPQPLPEWGEDFGDTFIRGLYALIIGLVYALPLIIIITLLTCVFGAIAGAGGSEEAAGFAILILNCLLYPIAIIGGIGTWLLVYAAYARYITSNYSLGEALKFGEVIATIRSKPQPWLMLLLVYFLSSIIASLGMIACFIGVIFTAFIGQCMIGHVLGQIIAQQGMTSTYAPDTPNYDPPPAY